MVQSWKVAVIIIPLAFAAVITTFYGSTLLGPSEASVSVGYVKSQFFLVPVFAAEKGFFEQEKLKVDAIVFPDGGKVSEALNSGEIQFGSMNMLGHFLVPASQGRYYKLVHFGSVSGILEGREYRVYDVIVRNELAGKVTKYKDLEGLKIGFMGPVFKETLIQALRKEGGDPQKLVFVEIPLAQFPTALASGSVDAILAPVPTSTRILLEKKGTTLGDPYLKLWPNLMVPINGWFTTEDYVSKNPDLVKRFQRGIDRAVQYIRENPQEWYDWASKVLNLPPEVPKHPTYPMLLDKYSAHPALGKNGVEGFKELVKLARDAKVFTGDVDAERIIKLPWEDPWK